MKNCCIQRYCVTLLRREVVGHGTNMLFSFGFEKGRNDLSDFIHKKVKNEKKK